MRIPPYQPLEARPAVWPDRNLGQGAHHGAVEYLGHENRTKDVVIADS